MNIYCWSHDCSDAAGHEYQIKEAGGQAAVWLADRLLLLSHGCRTRSTRSESHESDWSPLLPVFPSWLSRLSTTPTKTTSLQCILSRKTRRPSCFLKSTVQTTTPSPWTHTAGRRRPWRSRTCDLHLNVMCCRYVTYGFCVASPQKFCRQLLYFFFIHASPTISKTSHDLWVLIYHVEVLLPQLCLITPLRSIFHIQPVSYHNLKNTPFSFTAVMLSNRSDKGTEDSFWHSKNIKNLSVPVCLAVIIDIPLSPSYFTLLSTYANRLT